MGYSWLSHWGGGGTQTLMSPKKNVMAALWPPLRLLCPRHVLPRVTAASHTEVEVAHRRWWAQKRAWFSHWPQWPTGHWGLRVLFQLCKPPDDIAMTVSMKRTVVIAEVKYPKEEGWKHVWIFDHSSSCICICVLPNTAQNYVGILGSGLQKV